MIITINITLINIYIPESLYIYLKLKPFYQDALNLVTPSKVSLILGRWVLCSCVRHLSPSTAITASGAATTARFVALVREEWMPPHSPRSDEHVTIRGLDPVRVGVMCVRIEVDERP